MLPMDQAEPKPQVFNVGESGAESADFSPDCRYVAYLSAEAGQREIYIRPYQHSGGRETVSVGGGREPVWANNGDLFYRNLTGDRMFAVSVTTEPKLKVGAPVPLFQGPYYYTSAAGSPQPQITMSPLTDSGFSCSSRRQAPMLLSLVLASSSSELVRRGEAPRADEVAHLRSKTRRWPLTPSIADSTSVRPSTGSSCAR